MLPLLPPTPPPTSVSVGRGEVFYTETEGGGRGGDASEINARLHVCTSAGMDVKLNVMIAAWTGQT